MPVLLTTLWRKFALDQAGTRAATKLPSLVWEAPPTDAGVESSWQMTKTGSGLTRPTAGEAIVFTLEKAVSLVNPFPMGVTIGRVETNDVILEDGSVSRFHAWFQFDERANGWSLTDAESRNGTWVNGLRCEPRKRVLVPDGAELRIGDASLRFLLPEALFDFLNQRGESLKP